MTFHPRVSVVIPVYNGSNYLREAVDSALAQTYDNFEVIVVNDGSTDAGATEAIARSYGTRLRYFHKENGGVASALNFGIREMTGDYFSWLSHDDVFCPNKLAVQVGYLSSVGREVVLYGDYALIDERSKPLRVEVVGSYPDETLPFNLIANYPIYGCSTLIPELCFARVGTFNENLRTTQDYEMWFRLSRVYRFFRIPQVLAWYREHKGAGRETLKPALYKESHEFAVWALAQLWSERWSTTNHKSYVAAEFARVALRLRHNGFKEASELAFGFAVRGLRTFSPAAHLRCVPLLAPYLLYNLRWYRFLRKTVLGRALKRKSWAR